MIQGQGHSSRSFESQKMKKGFMVYIYIYQDGAIRNPWLCNLTELLNITILENILKLF